MELMESCMPMNQPLRDIRLRVAGAAQTLTKKYLGKSVPEKMDIITPHKLRSTFAMDYYAITQDVLSLQKILGHSNIQTTNIYAQATENSIRDTRNVIERKRIYE